MSSLFLKIKIAAIVLLYAVCITTGTAFCFKKRSETLVHRAEYQEQQTAINQCGKEIVKYKNYLERIKNDREFFEKILHDHGYVSLFEIEYTCK